MWIIARARLWLGIGIVFIIVSLVSIGVFGLSLGPDFTGGRTVVWNLGTEVSIEQLTQAVSEEGHTPRTIQEVNNAEYQIQLDAISNEQYAELKTSVEESLSIGAITEVSNTLISPTVGSELRDRAVIALGIVLIGIVIFIQYVFRGVSYPVPSLWYGLTAILALIHDIIIPTGIFAYLSWRGLTNIDVLFVIALLSILGSSVNDTIVVFDRIRENIRRFGGDKFEEIVGQSVDQTLIRSLNTSITLLIVLGAIVLFGGASIQYFALALFLGIFFGTYSSIFIASPLLVVIYRWRFKRG